jgi:hypothetical protein
MRRGLALAVIVLGTGAVQAARIDEGAIPDLGRFIEGCWVNDEGILAADAGWQVELCFSGGALDAALLDAGGVRLSAAPGSYAFRNEKIVLTGDADWLFGRPTLICDVGIKPYVRLGLFDCVGSGTDAPVMFYEDMLFLAQKPAAT